MIHAHHSFDISPDSTLPVWLPEKISAYMFHTVDGRSIRDIARDRGRHASTILRYVRRVETDRDDPLLDQGLARLERARTGAATQKGPVAMYHDPVTGGLAAPWEIEAEGRRILRRLSENDAFLLISAGLEKAAVMREARPGHVVRTAVVERRVAEAFALQDWIECYRNAKIARYRITHAGQMALKRMLAEDRKAPQGLEEATTPFGEQHKEWEDRPADGKRRRMRFNIAESPVLSLGRRKGPDGEPFLSPELVQAAERLREDFEMAQMGPRVTQNWDRFLTGGRTEGGSNDGGMAEGPRAARERVSRALSALGPGLGDIALRCCCYLEGLETAEKRMGWSARSGKIVLRIALQRLKLHYEEVHGTLSPQIG